MRRFIESVQQEHGLGIDVMRLFQVAWGSILEKVAMIAEVMLQLEA